jgi:predicted nucleic acid-binding protein
MTFAYFDTSALIKRYVRETGSAQVVALLRRHDLLSSAITPVEIMSALGRRRRDRDLSEQAFNATVNRVRSERLHWELIEVGETVLSRAEEIVQGSVPMRSLDAVHIASLMAFQSASGIRCPFVTSDGRQRDAATFLDLDIIWIG